MARRSYSGAAAPTTLASGITASDLSITVAAAAGWPDGSGGSFAVTIGRGEAGEETVLIGSRSGTTLTVASGGRGYDDTSATSHTSGATVEHTITAVDLDEANAHVNDSSGDPHPQYSTTAAVTAAIATHDSSSAHAGQFDPVGSAAAAQTAAETAASTALTAHDGDGSAHSGTFDLAGTGASAAAAAQTAAEATAAAALTAHDGDGSAHSGTFDLAGTGATAATTAMNAHVGESNPHTQYVVPGAGTYTPTLYNATLGNGTVGARFYVLGAMVFVTAQITWGSTSSIGSTPFAMGLPYSALANPAKQAGFNLYIVDNNSVVHWSTVGAAWQGTNDRVQFAMQSAGATSGQVGPNEPYSVDAGDVWLISGWFEATGL